MYKKSFLILLVMASLVFAQQSWNMGAYSLYTIKFGTNLELVRTSVTYLGEGDTVYTDILPIPPSIDGVYKVEFSATKYDTASTSLHIEVAFYNSKMAPSYKWTSWRNLWASANTEERVELTIDPADSAWWKPEAARQYRIYGSTDSCKIYLTDYIK